MNSYIRGKLWKNGASESSQDSVGVNESYHQIQEKLSKEIRPYLDAAEALKAVGSNEVENFPSIVVVGDQSEGKSTVMQAISGLRFPRDDKLCTKCPIELSLRIGAPNLEISYSIGGKFKQVNCEQEDFEQTIRRVQEELVSSNGSKISSDIIRVQLFRPDGFNLTLIDLPGINRGTKEIEDQTVQIIEGYIQSDDTVNIVVFKCTTDVSTVKAFQLTKKFDPTGSRTIGVITHCDLLSQNWEKQTKELVSGTSPEFKDIGAKAFIPVACNVFINDGPTGEKQALLSGTVFQNMNAEFGTKQLIVVLEREINEKLKPWKEKIKGLVGVKCGEYQMQLQDELNGRPTEADGSTDLAHELLTELIRNVDEDLSGTHRFEKNRFFSKQQRQFDQFEEKMREKTESYKAGVPDLVDQEYVDQRGSEDPLIVNLNPIKRRIINGVVMGQYKQVIDEVLKTSCLDLNDWLFSRLENLFSKYPGLENYMKLQLKTQVERCEEIAEQKVSDILFMESKSIETRNRLYKDKVEKLFQELYAEEKAEQENFDKVRVQYLVNEYLDVLADRIIDEVTNTIRCNLNLALIKAMPSLHSMLPKQQELHSMMQDPNVAERLHDIRKHLERWRALEESLKGEGSVSAY